MVQISLQGIHKITMYKRFGYYERTKNIEARVGSTQLQLSSIGFIPLEAYEKCGETTGDKPNKVEDFECRPPLDGQFVSLQNAKSAL